MKRALPAQIGPHRPRIARPRVELKLPAIRPARNYARMSPRVALLEKSRETPEVPRVRLMETPALVKAMIPLLWLLLAILASPLKSKRQLEAENVALRHQVVVLRR
jgi:hypothetical protein